MSVYFQVLSAIVGSGTIEDSIRPQLLDDYSILWMEDVTGRTSPPSEPLTTTVNCIASDSIFSDIENNSDYYILWDIPNPKPPNESPSAAEFGLLRAWLVQNGFSQPWISATIGVGVQGRSRSEIANELREGLRQL